MLAYLSKKISIPNDTLVTSLAWHTADGYLAVGGDNGLLRVLKLEIQQEDKDSKIKGLAAPSVLSMNQTLEAHQAAIVHVTWNNSKNKLTTCDKKGLIVVWFMFKNIWTQEMINNRNKSAVSMIQWNKEGQKICIVYEDGAVIVGSVDGNRIWGKELAGSVLTHVQWSPDSRVLLFGTNKGEVLIYDSLGAYNSKLSLHCLANSTGPVQLVSIQWYNGTNGYMCPNVPCLAVAFNNGQVQIMRHELDDRPVIINSAMIISTIAWNNNGSALALSGTQQRTDEREICTTRFYNPFGQLLYTLRIPGHSISSIAWEGTGLRLAHGIGSYIYFANIRYNYKWTFFSNTVIYTYTKPNSLDQCIMFWNVDTHQQNIKTCHDLLHLSSCKDLCLLITPITSTDDLQYSLLICNSLGIPIDSKQLPFEPTCAAISSTHVIATSANVIFVWHYRTLSNSSSLEFNSVINKALETQDRLLHIDDHEINHDSLVVNFDILNKVTPDPISGVTASEQCMVIGRMSGNVLVYSLPQLNINSVFTLQYQPVTLSLNNNSTCLSVIDNNGMFSTYSMPNGTKLGLERKEVWDMKWSDDNPDLFAIMEKTRMYIFRGIDPEEPIVSSASICLFSDLQVKALLLDELMKSPMTPNSSVLVELEIKSLRDTRQLLEKVGFEDTFQFINDNPHPRLWQLLAESALKAFNFDIAEKAFVKCSDYQGIQFVKKLKKLNSDDIRRAQIAAFYKDFDEAERIYIQMDRKDLAVDLRSKLGDWFYVIQLLKEDGAVGNDVQLANAWKSLGDYYAERQMWGHALGNYQASGDVQCIAQAHFMLEEYEELEKLSSTLPDNHSLLPDLAYKFRCMGMSEAAVSAYLRCDNPKEALECCIELNEWTEARHISRRFGLKDVDSMIAQRANELLNDNFILLAIELYRRASYFIEAAKLLTEVAKMGSMQKLPFVKLKKMYVMAGLMIEKYHRYVKSTASTHTGKVKSTLQGLLIEDHAISGDINMLDTAWHGAEGYHLVMLAQRLLYQGETERSMKLGLILQNYIDVLPAVLVYSLIVLSASSCQCPSIASQAMMNLEMLPMLTDSERDQYEELSIEMFRLNPPRGKVNPLMCPRCETPFEEWSNTCSSCNADLVICMSSGDVILNDDSWLCLSCKHRTHNNIASILLSCPLCHAPITN